MLIKFYETVLGDKRSTIVLPEVDLVLSKSFELNDFTNDRHSFDECPQLRNILSADLLAQGLQLSTLKPSWTSDVGSGMYILQGHETSVEEHRDDTAALFGLLVLESERIVDSVSFDTRPVLSYFFGGKKHKSRLNTGDFLVFNPNAKHSLAYYGSVVSYALFDVTKIKKKNK